MPGGIRISRPVVPVLLVVLVAASSLAAALRSQDFASDTEVPGHLGSMIYQAAHDERYEAYVQHYLAEHGLDHPRRMDLGGLSPLDAAHAILTGEARAGRTPADWLRLAQADSLLALRPAAPVQGDLVADVARLGTAAGAPLDAAQMDALRASAAALDPALRQPFADLVHRVADAYEAQLPLAASILARLPGATDPATLVLSAAEREAMLRNALDVVAATNEFRAAAEGLFVPLAVSAPTFRDPLGLVILGSAGDDTYLPNGTLRDAILVVDPAGDDDHLNSAGGACPDLLELAHACNGLALSVVLDLEGNDEYLYAGEPAAVQGTGSFGGVGILVDASGDDSYRSTMTRGTKPPITMYVDGGAQGYGQAGVGILLDAAGTDVRQADVASTHRMSIWDMAQGFGNLGGVGIAADAAGDDRWLANGLASDLGTSEFQGLYPHGTGFYGGVGILAQTGGGANDYHAWDNATTTDYYAEGFGAFGGTGIFFDDAGDDSYQAVEIASTGTAIFPLLNCAFGTGSFGGLGIFLEGGGNDHYYGDSYSPRGAATMNEGFGGPGVGEGLFVDVSGDDGHFMYAHGSPGPSITGGRGVLLGGGEAITSFLGAGNAFGAYLDLGGVDQYAGAPPSRDNGQWVTGLDVNLLPGSFQVI